METMIALLEKSNYEDVSPAQGWLEFTKKTSEKTIRIYPETERILLTQERDGEVTFSVSHFFNDQDDILRLLKRNCFV